VVKAKARPGLPVQITWKQITWKPGEVPSRDLANPAASEQGKLLMAPFLKDISEVTGL